MISNKTKSDIYIYIYILGDTLKDSPIFALDIVDLKG